MYSKYFNKKHILIAVISFSLGLAVMYLFAEPQYEEAVNLTGQLKNSCSLAMNAASDLVHNCNESKDEIVTCFRSLSTCDQIKSTEKLDSLDSEAQRLNSNLLNYTKDLEPILKKYEQIK